VFGDEIGVGAQAVARALELRDDGMVQQPVEQRSGDDWVPEDLAPFGEAPVGGQDHRAFFVPRVDKLEQQIAAALDDGEVADFIDDQQRGAAVEADAFAQAPPRSARTSAPTMSASVEK
jgi:hypothetical protein